MMSGYRETIDQVIQNGQPVTMPIEHPGDSAISINHTRPLTPLSPQKTNDRSDNTRVTRRPTSQGHYDHYGVSSSPRSEKKYREDRRAVRHSNGSTSSRSGRTTTQSRDGTSVSNGANIADFFGPEVFRIVLQNPTTAHRLKRFCQSRACGENMEFLQKVNAYHRLLDELTQLLSTIHHDYIAPDALNQINLPSSQSKKVSSDIKQVTHHTIPTIDSIFAGSQGQVERLLASDIYPRFVKHQITASATAAFSNHRERFAGLGDCFCLTDPRVADNPIVYASDGFVSVTGYTRRDIIPRNCRFLQGEQTDNLATKRLKESIYACEETVELLLNYRKNGDPFWNLLYVSPLFNERGEVSYFLGGQINCSTTIHSCTDVLKVLSINDDELDAVDELASRDRPSSLRNRDTGSIKTRSSFFKSFRKYRGANVTGRQVIVRDEAGMEGELLDRVGKLSFKTQVEAFYTAYSKYLVMDYNPMTQTLLIQHYSPGVIDMLCLNLPNGGVAPIYNKDIFKVLAEHANSSSSSTSRTFKTTVMSNLTKGKAVSVETGLLTGFMEKKGGGWFGGGGREREKFIRVEES
ncbi:hypothetical protein BGZ60DRAFT_517847 [Tricladium varicosporioides]|nr:hypothetical protein BGZ60DRAFT_517847 [Hymenoscyphus varicosporioides]